VVKRSFLRRVRVLFFVSSLIAIVISGMALRLRDACAQLHSAVRVDVIAMGGDALPLVIDVDLAQRDPSNERKRQQSHDRRTGHDDLDDASR